jgi:parallel beta-helix repeat protein
MGLLDKWNKNKFSIYNSEEKTVLKLIESIGKWLEELIKVTDGKTDLYGDHKGSWQGLNRPTLSEEGMRATVEKLQNEYSNVGNIVTNDIQKVLNETSENSEIIINSLYNVDNIILENKNNIKISGSGKINQITSNYQVQTNEVAVSNFALFKIRNCSNIVIEGIHFSSVFESIDVQGCYSIKFINCTFDGKENTSLFNGVVARDSTNISFENCTVEKFSEMPTYNTTEKINNYALGEGFSFYNVDGVEVINCKAFRNAKNGVYTFGCKNVKIHGNIIAENGMSGIQLAFAYGDERNYSIENNVIEYNYSDGLDINNTMNLNISINCSINNNKYKDNGWFNKNKSYTTQDGSGVATLVNVSDVKGNGNFVNDCCRNGLYISNCSNISLGYNCIKSNQGLGPILYIGKSNNIYIDVNGTHSTSDDNAIALDSNFGDVENVTITGYCESNTMLPHYTKGSNKFTNVKFNNMTFLSKTSAGNSVSNDVIYDNCTFRSTQATGINIAEGAVLTNCNIISDTREGLYAANKIKLINCRVQSPSYAMINWNSSANVFSNCYFYGDVGVRVSGGTGLIFDNCKCVGKTGAGIHILDNAEVTVYNCTLNSNAGNSIRVENGCVIKYGENIELAPSDFTTSTKKTIQWN